MAPSVSGDMNQRLLGDFTEEEVKVALFQMNPLSAPNLDGFPASFYQKNGNTLGADVCKSILRVLSHGDSLRCVIDTFIALIPKVKKP